MHSVTAEAGCSNLSRPTAVVDEQLEGGRLLSPPACLRAVRRVAPGCTELFDATLREPQDEALCRVRALGFCCRRDSSAQPFGLDFEAAVPRLRVGRLGV